MLLNPIFIKMSMSTRVSRAEKSLKEAQGRKIGQNKPTVSTYRGTKKNKTKKLNPSGEISDGFKDGFFEKKFFFIL